MTAIMGTCIFIATCIGGYFTGKLRLDGRIRDFLKAEEKKRDGCGTEDYPCGELNMIQEVEDFLDGKKGVAQ